MEDQDAVDIRTLHNHIQEVRKLLEALKADGAELPFMVQNSKRALSSVKMMELNLSDLVMLAD